MMMQTISDMEMVLGWRLEPLFHILPGRTKQWPNVFKRSPKCHPFCILFGFTKIAAPALLSDERMPLLRLKQLCTWS